jgi:hypothetical protein
MTSARVTQDARESLVQPPASARVTQAGRESLVQPPASARVTQVAREVLVVLHPLDRTRFWGIVG